MVVRIEDSKDNIKSAVAFAAVETVHKDSIRTKVFMNHSVTREPIRYGIQRTQESALALLVAIGPLYPLYHAAAAG